MAWGTADIGDGCGGENVTTGDDSPKDFAQVLKEVPEVQDSIDAWYADYVRQHQY